jgi:Transposase C of IS166 homeodomain
VPAKSLALIENLKLVIEKYRRMIFGRKSEKLTAQLEQLEFRLEELETAQAADEAMKLHRMRRKLRNRVLRRRPRSAGVLHASHFRKIFRVK